MKARGRNLVHVVMPVLVVCLLVLTCTVYAAPATTQKSPQQVQPAGTTSPASIKYDPNAPPKGTITIPTSTKGNVNASTWFSDTYQYIEWTCTGTYSKRVDVTLWHNNSKYADIGKGISTGQTAYRVPNYMVEGNYELRITSQDDPRVEARKVVYVKLYEVTITAPKANEVLYLGDSYTVTWTYKGNPGHLDFSLRTDKWDPCKGCVVSAGAWFDITKVIGEFSSIKTGMGQGSVVWKLPDQPPQSLPNLFYLIASSGFTPSKYNITSPKFQLACKHSYCNGHCADLLKDAQNCGSCLNDCEKVKGKGFNCMNGACGCFYGRTICGNVCADLQSDFGNCGKCGIACTSGHVCFKGSCMPWTLFLPGTKQCPGGHIPYFNGCVKIPTINPFGSNK